MAHPKAIVNILGLEQDLRYDSAVRSGIRARQCFGFVRQTCSKAILGEVKVNLE